jgi:hypothetical protein
MGEVQDGTLRRLLKAVERQVEGRDFYARVGWRVFKRAANDAACVDLVRGTHGAIRPEAARLVVEDAEAWLRSEPLDPAEWRGLVVEDALRLAGVRRDLGPFVADLAAAEREQNSLWIRVCRQCRIREKGRVAV